MLFKTEQEKFWDGKFGDEYVVRNNDKKVLPSNLNLFSKIFNQIDKPNSLIEFGANTGLNLRVIKLLFPNINLFGIEINKSAAEELAKFIKRENVFNKSILDFETSRKYDISLIKGVLIHINPEMLKVVYEKLYRTSNQYIIICEYYSPTPVVVNYRGHTDRLFKRDFSGEMLDMYDDLELVDYGFSYHRDKSFPSDDPTWFVLKKR